MQITKSVSLALVICFEVILKTKLLCLSQKIIKCHKLFFTINILTSHYYTRSPFSISHFPSFPSLNVSFPIFHYFYVRNLQTIHSEQILPNKKNVMNHMPDDHMLKPLLHYCPLREDKFKHLN